MYRLRDLTRRQTVAAAVLGLLLLVPFGVSVAHAINVGWLPSGDDALIGLRSRDALEAARPLIGQPSTSHLYGPDAGTSHPGPIEFYWLAVPIRALGPSIGMIVGILAVNLASVAVACWVVLRRAGPVVAAWSMVVASFVLWSEGTAVLTDPISSNAGGIALLALAMLAWAVADGDVRLAPLAVLFASWVTQQHLAIVVPALALTAFATVGVLATGRPLRWRWLASAAALGMVLWSPVLWQQATGDQGNLSALIDYAQTSQVTKLGAAAGMRQAARAVGMPPLPFRSDLAGDAFFGGPLSPLEVLVAAATLAALVAVAIGCWRRRRTLALLAVTALVLMVAGAYNGAKIPNSVEAFRINFYRWTFVVAWLAWVALGWALCLFAKRAYGHPGRPLRSAAPRWAMVVAAILMAVPAAGAAFTSGFDDERRDQTGFEAMRRMSDLALDETVGASQVTLVLRGRSSVVATGSAVALQLEDGGRAVVLPEQDPRFWGDHRVLACGDDPGDKILMLSSGRGEVPSSPGRLVERIDLNEDLRAQIAELAAVTALEPVVPSAHAEDLLVKAYRPEQRGFIRAQLAVIDSDPARVLTNPELVKLIAQGYYASPILDPAALDSLRSGPAPVIVNDEDVFELRVLSARELAQMMPGCKGS